MLSPDNIKIQLQYQHHIYKYETFPSHTLYTVFRVNWSKPTYNLMLLKIYFFKQYIYYCERLAIVNVARTRHSFNEPFIFFRKQFIIFNKHQLYKIIDMRMYSRKRFLPSVFQIDPLEPFVTVRVYMHGRLDTLSFQNHIYN